MIFAREVSDSLTSLVKKIDAATVENKSCRMGSFIVFCSDADEDELKTQLKELAKKEDLKKIILTIDKPDGPTKYKVAKEADVTVILYLDKTVEVNHAFKKGELNDKAIDGIIADLKKITVEKKKPEKKTEKETDK